VKVRIQHVIEDGIEGAVLFGVGENDDAEIFFGHEHDARDESADPAGVADKLAAVIIAQCPAQGVVGEISFSQRERAQDSRWAGWSAATTFLGNAAR